MIKLNIFMLLCFQARKVGENKMISYVAQSNIHHLQTMN